MIETRNLLWIGPLLLLVSAPVWRPPLADFLRPAGEDIATEVSPGTGRSFSMTEVFFYQNRNGSDEWRIKTDMVLTDDNEKNLKMKNVDAVFFGADSRPRAKVNSRSGNYDTETGVLTLTEEVVATTDEGYVLQTPVLRYLNRSRQINSEHGVRITGSKVDIRGQRLFYDMESGNYRLSGRVVGNMW